jgi:hypothetical protein
MIVFGYLLAFLTPLLGRIAPDGLALLTLVFAISALVRGKDLKLISWGAPLLGVYCGWLVLLLWNGLGIEGAQVLISWGGVTRILDWLRSENLNGFGWFVSFRNLFILLASFGLIAICGEDREKIQKGLLLGTFIAALSLILDNYGVISQFLPKANIHWENINRVSGLFADPNSAGIFLGLMIPFIIPPIFARNFFYLIVAATIITAGLMSGSRSFIIALALSTFFYIPRPNIRKAIAAIAAVLFIATLIFAKFYEESYTKGAAYLPRSLERVALTLVNSEGNDSFESRTIFGKMAFAMFQDYPLAGVGPNGFRGHFNEYEKKIGIDLEGWEDNANNFYLGIVAELGVIGVVGLLLTVFGLKPNPKAGREEKHAALILALLLILGPHFDFVEVAIESGLLLGLAFIPRNLDTRASWRYLYTGLILLLAVFLVGSFGNLGVYKGASTGDNARWTSVRAYPVMPCLDGQSLVQFEAHHASAATPVTVKLNAGEQVFTEILASREMRTVSFGCPGEQLEIEIITEPPFRPASNNPLRPNKIIFGVNILNYPGFK